MGLRLALRRAVSFLRLRSVCLVSWAERSRLYLVLLMAALGCSTGAAYQRGEAQQNVPSTPACTPSDLFATPWFSTGQDGFFTLAFDFRNISDHNCSLGQPQYSPSFVPDRVAGYPPIQYRWPSAPIIPLVLLPGHTDHLAYRWRTSATKADPPCVQLKWTADPVLINAPTLLKQVCSDIEVGLYESGTFQPEADQSAQLVLSAPKSSFFLDEPFFLTISGPRSLKDKASPCPELFRLARSPGGFSRLDEINGAGFVGCRSSWPGRKKGDWNTGFLVDAGTGQWEGLGEHEFELFEQLSPQDSAIPRFRRTQILDLQIVDPSKISRNWGPRVKGVAADVSLDKSTYQLNEDIPLHIAVENFSAPDSVHAWDPVWDPCQGISVYVLDAHGRPLRDSARQGFNPCFGHGFGARKVFPQGSVYPMERSLIGEGWLPKDPGVYTIVIAWAPFIGSSVVCTQVEARAEITVLPPAGDLN